MQNIKNVITIKLKQCFLVLALALTFVSVLSACSKTPQEQFKSALLDLGKNEMFLKQLATSFRLTGEKQKILVEHFEKLFTEEYVNYYVATLDKEGAFNIKDKTSKSAQQNLVAKTVAIANGISNQGINRLDDDLRAAYYAYNSQIINYFSPRVCKQYVVGDNRIFASREIDKASASVFKKFSNEQLERYLEALRSASLAVIKDSPKPYVLSEEQIQKAQEILADAQEKELALLPQAKKTRLIRASNDLVKANPIDACAYGKFLYSTVENMQNDEDKRLVINYLLYQN